MPLNARVAAMPQAPAGDDQYLEENNAGSRGRRNRGITMEDLKQQTALRLAQAQQQRDKDRNGAEGDEDDLESPHLGMSGQLPPMQRADVYYPEQHPYYYQQALPPPHGYVRNQPYLGYEDRFLQQPVPPPPSHDVPAPLWHPEAITEDIGPYHFQRPPDGGDENHQLSQRSAFHDFGGGLDFGAEALTPKTSPAKVPFQQIVAPPCVQNDQQPPSPPADHNEQWRTPKAGIRVARSNVSLQAQTGKRFEPQAGCQSPTHPLDHYQFPPRSSGKQHSKSTNANGGTSFEDSKSPPFPRQSNNGKHHSKLPHGLTVQELKEMTRARLAAEAAEDQSQGEDNSLQPPQPFGTLNSQIHQTLTPNRARFGSSGSTSSWKPEIPSGHRLHHNVYSMRQRTASVESTSSAPPAIVNQQQQPTTSMSRTFSHQRLCDQAIHGNIDQKAFHPRMQRHGHIQAGPTHHPHTPQGKKQSAAPGDWTQQLDASETVSVTSLNSAVGSEFMGPESAFPAGPGGIQKSMAGPRAEESPALPFGRSCSYPLGANMGGAMESQEATTTATVSSSLFDSSVGYVNRRRAVTMSPPGLSHLMENEPLKIASREELCIPTFDMLQSQSPSDGLATKMAEFSNSPLGSRVSSPANLRMTNSTSAFGDSMQDLLHRPPSVTTVPGFHSSADGLDAHEDVVFRSFSFANGDHSLNIIGPSFSRTLPESEGDCLANPVIGRDMTSANADIGAAGVASVFRSMNQIGGNNSLLVSGRELTMSSTVSSQGLLFVDAGNVGVGAEGRSVASAKSWGGPSSSRKISSHGLGHVQKDAFDTNGLEEDLNALLNISEHSGDGGCVQGSVAGGHQRVTSLVSKIDPELKVTGPSTFDRGLASPTPLASFASSNDPVLYQSNRNRSYSDGRVIGRF